MPTNTPKFGFFLPLVNDPIDSDVWGVYSNTNIISYDNLFFLLSTTALGNSPPSYSNPGVLWVNNSTSNWILSINDGVQQVSIGTINTVAHTFTPSGIPPVPSPFFVGDFKFSVKFSDHGQWLLCNGRPVSRTIYSALYNSYNGSGVNWPFGQGDGRTTFTLPNMAGRVPGAIGLGTGLTLRTIGQLIGEENHTLTIAEMPSHSHGVRIKDGGLNVGSGPAPITNRSSNPDYNTDLTGGGRPHNNMQPTAFIGCMFIYAGV